MKYTLIPCKQEGVHLSQRKVVNFFIPFSSGIIPGGKENDRTRQAFYFTPLNPFGNDAQEEKPSC